KVGRVRGEAGSIRGESVLERDATTRLLQRADGAEP
ncbi:MAG: hypothetical protein RLZZ461_1745, partial [Planctomycetota bacterium]